MLNTDQIGQECHQLQRLSEPAVAHRLPGLAVGFQLEDLLARNFEHPAGGPVVLWPRLRASVSRIAEFDVLQMQVDARKPLVDEFRDAAIRWGHVAPGQCRIMHGSSQAF